jgi:hypothetical protein
LLLSDPFSTLEENIRLINSAFSGKMTYSKEEIKQYFDSIGRRYQELDRNSLRDHSVIQKIVGNYLVDMGWNVQYETAFADFDYNIRFDIMAKKHTRTIVVEVKPEIDREIVGQILEYIFNIKTEIENAKFFLATDILNLPFIFNNGVITEIIMDFAEKYNMGIILIDSTRETSETWLIPAEFILASN